MRITALTIALALVPVPAFAAKQCKKGKPCGNTCIAVSKTCHVGTGTSDGRTMDAFVLPSTPAPTPPVFEPRSTASVNPTSGFSEASQAALACGGMHGAAPNQRITVELVVDDRGDVVSSSATGVARTTVLGECVAEVAEEHFQFSSSELGLRISRYTFVVGSPDSVGTPTPPEAPAITTTIPKPCRREDYESFEAFVECRVAEQGSSAAPVVVPPVDLAEQARQHEADEARAELGRKAKERAIAQAEEELRARRAVLALAIPGGVLDATGLGLVAAAVATGTGEPATHSFDDGPTCTIGKRCGDTCIAVELTCHTSTGGGSVESNPALLWPGIATMAVGSGLLVVALVLYRRNESRPPIIVDARGVGFRF